MAGTVDWPIVLAYNLHRRFTLEKIICPYCEHPHAKDDSEMNCESCSQKFTLSGNSENEAYAIIYDDAEVQPEIIFGREAAEKSFEIRVQNWNCYLFKMIKNGSERSGMMSFKS